MSSRRIALTGATGFLGSHLLETLMGTDLDVAVLIHQTPILDEAVSSGVSVVRTGLPDWQERLLEFDPDCVIHTATRFQVNHDRRDISPMIRANVEFGTELLQISAETGARLVTFSSFWQRYEGRSQAPMNLYAATKQAFDDVADYFRDDGLDLTRLTLFDVYGPGDTRVKLVTLLVRAALSGDPLEASSGNQLIDLTYVDDVVEAVLQVALESDAAGEGDFVVRSGALPLRNVASTLSEVVGRPVPVVWGARPDRPREMRQDWEMGTLLPGWSPRVSLSEGLSRVWTEVQNEGSV